LRCDELGSAALIERSSGRLVTSPWPLIGLRNGTVVGEVAGVTFRNVAKVYPDGTRAVDDLTLKIREGEFVVIVGPSGSGKTTALRMVAGLEEISEGTIAIGGLIVNHVPARDRDIAMVFQSYALYPHLSVFENIAFGLKVKKLARQLIRRRVDEAAELLDLRNVLDRKPRTLSGGQRQRVAMGRAIVREPSVFLMDEPLSNLDAQLRVHTRAEIGRLQRQLGITTIYVTHDQVEAMTLSDRVAVMRHGRLQQFAPPQELYERPENAFVGGFIGSPSMNFLEGTIQRSNGDISVLLGVQRLALHAAVLQQRPMLGRYEGKQVIVGIRPESIHDAALVPGSPPHARLHGTVELREALGSELFIHFSAAHVRPANTASIADLPQDTSTVVLNGDSGAMLVGRFDARSQVHEGGAVDAVVDTGSLHFFDPATGAGIYGVDPGTAESQTALKLPKLRRGRPLAEEAG
jgi:multiple sugar transport system ATP-binding protein